MNLQRKCRRPCQQLQIVNLQASSSTQTALIVLTTAGRSMHYLALSHILLRHICVATAWEQLLGSFCSCCFHDTAALDNSMSANCGISCPRYKRPTSYLCGIAQFISTRIASSQLKSNVLSHSEFWVSHVENVLWLWHRALHCACSQRNPKKLVRKGRGYWPAQAGQGTAGEGWQQNNKCWSHHQLGPNNRLCGDHVVDPQHYSYSYSYSTAAIDRWSTTTPSKSVATPNLVSNSSSSSQNYRTQQQDKQQQQQQLLLLYASGGCLNQQHMSVLRHHSKKMLVATNKYCGERRMRRRKGE